MTKNLSKNAATILEDLRAAINDAEDEAELTTRALEALEDGECLANNFAAYTQEEIEEAYDAIEAGYYFN
jgi:hypothetical protein